MSFELRTFFRSTELARGRLARSLGPLALMFFWVAQAACSADIPVDLVGGAGGAPPRADGALDGPLQDRSGGMTAGGRSEGGDPETRGGDDAAEGRAVDVFPADGAVDGASDADQEPGDPPRDVLSEDASEDATEDNPTDGPNDGQPVDAPLDARPDGGPIVIGPPFWRSVRFAVFGDYGMANTDEARVANLVQSWDVDFVITTGDNNYTGLSDGIDGVIGRYYSSFIGNYWGAYGPGSRTTRFWPSPGNHDWDVADLAAYTDYFTLPGNERYYDVGLGLVHLFALDSDPREPDGTTADSVQGRWLRGRLARSTSCFNIVYFHHPAYSSGPHGSSLDMRWPFEAWGADVVLAGHDHVYERFEVGQIPYFTVGLGGASPYPFVTSLPETRTQFNSDFGAMRITANRRGINFEFIDANGTLVESFASRKRCR